MLLLARTGAAPPASAALRARSPGSGAGVPPFRRSRPPRASPRGRHAPAEQRVICRYQPVPTPHLVLIEPDRLGALEALLDRPARPRHPRQLGDSRLLRTSAVYCNRCARDEIGAVLNSKPATPAVSAGADQGQLDGRPLDKTKEQNVAPSSNTIDIVLRQAAEIVQDAVRVTTGADLERFRDASQVAVDASDTASGGISSADVASVANSLTRPLPQSLAHIPEQVKGVDASTHQYQKRQRIAAGALATITNNVRTEALTARPPAPANGINVEDAESRHPKQLSRMVTSKKGVRSAKQARQDQLKRGRIRSGWLDQRLIEKRWTADSDIAINGGPSYNTIQRYRSGRLSTRDRYVRIALARAFGCEVPPCQSKHVRPAHEPIALLAKSPIS